MPSERIPVYEVMLGVACVPVSLGLVEAYARSRPLLRERLDFRRLRSPRAEEIEGAPPGIWLFPDYIWSYDENLKISRAVKACSQRNLTIHGGPSFPKYPGACDRFLRAESHVDVGVRGEGEVTTAALLEHVIAAMDAGGDWRDGLDRIEGVSFLATPRGELVQTPDRARIQDLDTVPSPYLDGTLDRWLLPTIRLTTIETTRGCPYGCTFCDWGSATLQKIHKFSLDRILGEIEWAAANHVPVLFLSDANFGTFERDVEIAEHIGRMRERHGFPRETVISYAKNGNDRIPDIVRAMVSAGIVAEGVISIQTRDPAALRAVRRENIKTGHYEKLVGTFRDQGLPVTTDLMVGLPGSTLESHKRDLQWCLDEDLVARSFRTFVLPNSPMADPDYVAEHGIEIRNGMIVGTHSASEQELMKAWDLVLMYELAEKSTLLRYVTRYLQWEHGLAASDLLLSLSLAIRQTPERFPDFVHDFDRMGCLNAMMESSDPFYEAVWNHVREVHGVPLGSEADYTVFRLNQFVLPRRGVVYPLHVESGLDLLGYFGSCVSPPPGERRALQRAETPQHFDIADRDGLSTLDFERITLQSNALRLFELDWPVRNRAMFTAIY